MPRSRHILLYALIILAPLGTRWIIEVARIGNATVESATHGVFATQLLAAIAVIAVLVPLRRSPSLRLGSPDKLALALLALASFSAAFAPDAIHASATVVRLGLGVAVFIAVSRARLPVRGAAWALLAMAAIQAAFGLAQFAFQAVPADTMLGVSAQAAADAGTSVVETPDGRWLRAYGTLPHPNVLGFAAAAGALAGIWLMVETPSILLPAALTALSVAGMIFSFSRAGILAFMFGTIAFVAEALRLPGTRKRYVLAAAAVTATVICAVALVPDAWLTRTGAEGRLETVSVSERRQSLVNGADLIMDAPVLGVGPGLMPFAVAEKYPYRDDWSHQPAHAVPLLVAAEVGIPAMLVWLLFIAALLAVGFRSMKRSATVPYVAVLLAVFVASLFDHYFWTTWPGQLMFWLLAGLLWGELRLSYAPPKRSPSKKA